MIANKQLIDAFTKALAVAPLLPEEQQTWRDLFPTFTEEELKSVVDDLTTLTQAHTEIVAGVQALQNAALLDSVAMEPKIIRNLSEVQLLHPSTIEAVHGYILLLATNGDHGPIIATRKILEEIVHRHLAWIKTYPAVLQKYEEYIALLKFLILSALKRPELRDLFERFFLTIVASGVPVIETIDRWLASSFLSPSLVDDLATVLQGVRNASEHIGIALIDRGERGSVPPTVRNWLIEYDVMVPPQKIRGAVEEGTFLTKNKNVQRLSANDRALLIKVLQTIDALFFPAAHQTIVSRERALPIFPRSEPVSSIPPSRPSLPPKPLTIFLQVEPEKDKKIFAAKDALRKQGGDVLALFTVLVLLPQGINGTTPEELIAGFLLLAEDNILEKAIVEPRLKERFLIYLKSKQAPDLLEGFRLTPTMPKFMTLFLQWVLHEKAKLGEEEAARIGMQVANILRKRGNEKYARIAYFDAATGKCKWG